MQRKRIGTMLITGILLLSMCIPTFAATTTDYQTLKNALNEAQKTYENATNEKEEARIAFEKQEKNTDPVLDSVRELSGDELSATIDSLKTEAEEAKNNYALAVVPYNESLDTLNGGAFSFFKWVADNYPGYADDANNAIAVLEKAESLGYITDVVYSEDQTSFYSMKVAERYMEDYVTLRAYLGIEYVPMTNLTAVADSMMSVGGAKTVLYHYSAWLNARGWDENLSFGYGIYSDYDIVYNGELVEILGYVPNATIGEEEIDYAEISGDAELVNELETESESENPLISEDTTTEAIEETTEIISSEEITEPITETITENITEDTSSSETEETTEVSTTTTENAEEQSSESEATTEELVVEDTTETEENILLAAEEKTTTEVTYPTYDEWFAEEVANGMLDACPFLNKNVQTRSPFAGWYTAEKYNYDLIQKYNYNNGGQVGHYYNLTRKRNSEIFAMGMKGSAFVLDMQTYYDAGGTPTTGLSAGINYCTHYATMSVSEYNSLLDAFYNSLNLKSQKDTIEGYKAQYQNAITKLTYCKAKKTYEDKCTAFNETKAIMEAAQNAVLTYAPYSPEVSLCNVSAGIKISWNAVDTGKRYYVYRKTTDADWSMIAITKATTYVDRKAENGTVYYYAVLTENMQRYRSEYLFSNKKMMRVESVKLKTYYGYSYKYPEWTDPIGYYTMTIFNDDYDGEIVLFREEDDGSLTQLEFVNNGWNTYINLTPDNTPLNKEYTYYYKLVKDGYESITTSIKITLTDGVNTIRQTKRGNTITLSWTLIKMLDNQKVNYRIYRKFVYSNGNETNWYLQSTVTGNKYTYTVKSTNYTVKFLVIPVLDSFLNATISIY